MGSVKYLNTVKAFIKTVKARLLFLVFLVVFPFMVLLLASAISDLRSNIAISKADAINLGKNAARNFSEGMNLTKVILTDLVSTSEMRNTDNCLQVFPALRSAYERLTPELVNLSLADAQGKIYCAINPVKGDIGIDGTAEYQRALQTSAITLGSYEINPISKDPQFNVVYPVLSYNGKIQTLIVATYSGLWVQRWHNTILFPANSTLGLIGPSGTLMYWQVDGDVKNADALKKNLRVWVNGMLASQGTIEGTDLDGVNRLLTVVPLESNEQRVGYLILGYPVADLYRDANYKLAGRLMLSILITFIAAIIAKYSSENLFLNPLEKVMSVVKKVEEGDLSARISNIAGIQELGVLAKSFDQMTDSLQQREMSKRLADARFRALYDNIAVGVAIMSLDRKLVQVNPTATIMTGYSEEEMTQLDVSTLPIPEDRYIDRELFQQMIKGERDQYLIEKRYLRKNGEMFWGRVNFAMVKDDWGKPSYVVGIIEDITEEKTSKEKLAIQEADHLKLLESRISERTDELNKANEMLREKAAQDAVVTERTRLARDLHDAVTQTLFSATLIADVLPEIWDMNIQEGKRRLEELRLLTRGALAEMRTLLVELRPNALVEVPLPSLLKQLAEALTGRSRINIVTYSEGDRKLPPDVQVALYRLTQEALNNVVKHAKANQAIVTLVLDHTVRLVVADDGIGFKQSGISGDHLGLKIMRERAESIGASLKITSSAGEGTQVSITWPSS